MLYIKSTRKKDKEKWTPNALQRGKKRRTGSPFLSTVITMTQNKIREIEKPSLPREKESNTMKKTKTRTSSLLFFFFPLSLRQHRR
jgi:hypothetical protein